MWKADVPLFMTGRFAALRVGPGAANLEGARLGAERIVWGLQDVFKQGEGGQVGGGGGGGEQEEEEDQSELRYASGIGSRFESLEVEG